MISTLCRNQISKIVSPFSSASTFSPSSQSSSASSPLSYINFNNNSIRFNNNSNRNILNGMMMMNLQESTSINSNIDINDDSDAIGFDDDCEITIAPSPLEIDPLIASLSAPSLQPYRLSSFLDQPSTLNIVEEQQEQDGIECVKRTYQPSVLIRKRRHGFLHRLSSKGGRRVLVSRIQKGRNSLSA
ncbi:hypothetical protein PPL_02220 [Heterostelium album PN500]|uniref:Large ribosomal subunit protein bL34m n=1 Tax=Heterostelium pallidum (strain ATCC 26659 / Pp 5 / PN500) TaxID=670386 RepID=D3B1P6_HETP5|nr:hypothetical protein PPL_02220 [Heterostelium album PN500]EFA85220.1 hypothetical protein PPL_02220 [Heterostelium album PN500]|eukprot:XP_020437329.1 hypothetical protein PPL_02220 [Heterostelium album PN500]